MPPTCFATLTLLAACVLSNGTLTPANAIGVAASAAALVAARERRYRAMAVTAGFAAGASTIGLALLPVLFGAAIANRISRATLLPFAFAAAGVAWSVGCSPAPQPSLAALLPAGTHILLVATASGVAAWLAASCAARPPLPCELDAAALLAAVALPLLAPLGVEAMALAVALALGGTRPTLVPIAWAANDALLPLRAASA